MIVVLEGELLGGALQPDLTQRLLRRLTQRGTLAEGSTPSNLTAVLELLGQRLQWAMSADLEYPAAMIDRTIYHLVIPASSVPACITALRQAGAERIAESSPTTGGWEMRPTGPDGALERHSIYPADSREVTAGFPEIAPDPAYDERIIQLSALAEHHGGQYAGASW